MKLATEKQGVLSRLIKDRRGNFGMMTALLLPVLLGAGGISIDLTQIMMTKSRLQDAADSAALAAASALANDKYTDADAKLLAMQFLKTQMQDGSDLDDEAAKEKLELLSNSEIDIKQIATVGTGKQFVVQINAQYGVDLNPLTRLLVKDVSTVKASTSAKSATESKNALSMFLVLDRSGSMSFITNDVASTTQACQNYTESNWSKYPDLKATKPCYTSKISALKLAVANLVTQLNTADPNKELVRTAAVSYNDKMFTETKFAWGTDAALAYVNAIPTVPTGGTDSHAAFGKAYEKLTVTDATKNEEYYHKEKNGQDPTKYIVFMTDGENTAYNGTSNDSNSKKSDKETKAYCDLARTAKIRVYTVAFMAPTRGQELLKYCSTTTSHYYEAKDMAQLVAAFKTIGEQAAGAYARLTK